MRPGWWAVTLVAIALLPAFILLLIDNGGEATAQLTRSPRPVVVGRLVLHKGDYVAGHLLQVQVDVRSDRTIPVDRIVVQLHDSAGRSTDLAGHRLQLVPDPSESPRAIFPHSKPFDVYGSVADPGSYTYFLAYHSRGLWHDLPPYYHVVIR